MEPIPEHTRGAKRQRLATACDQCRKRKVRCDERQPQCRHCAARGDVCRTSDPKLPGRQVARRRTAAVGTSVSPSSAASGPDALPRVDVPDIPSLSRRHESISRSNHAPSPQSSLAGSSHAALGTSSALNHGDSSAQEDPRQNNIEGSYEGQMILNTDNTTHKKKFLGGGSLQALAKHLDCLFEQAGWKSIADRFAFGMQYAEELLLPRYGTMHRLPALPALSEMTWCLSVFRRHIYPIYQIIDLTLLEQAMRQFHHTDLSSLPAKDVPVLCCAYSVLAIAVDEQAGSYTAMGLEFLTAAYMLYAHVISTPYLSSVQALLLLTIGLRARNKDGAAWQALGQAIRIAQSIGLHRRSEDIVHTPDPRSGESNFDFDARVWWACYCLEKTMGLEVGRPLAIRDSECNQSIPCSQADGLHHGNLLLAQIRLAQIQGRLIDIIYNRPPDAKNAPSFLGDIGSIDGELRMWATEMCPEEIRPSSNLLCAPADLPVATFLSMLYFQTLIAAHQMAFMVDSGRYQAAVKQHCRNSSSAARLANSERIIVQSARSIASLQMDLSDRRIVTQLLTMTPILMAIIVLGLNIMKYPTGARSRSDLEMLLPICHLAETQYAAAGQDPEFIKAIYIIRGQLERHVHGSSRNNPNDNSQLHRYFISPPGSSQYHLSPGNVRRTFDGRDSNTTGTAQMTNASVETFEDQSFNLLHNMQLDYPWDWVLSDKGFSSSGDWNPLAYGIEDLLSENTT
ncbi:hypothetical protein BP6252_01841 [Coleophoma cylindrospora]|uniref:Zn(2)-C6 fungal-type domain-containing protein n=1 Tax=Coleophoma cylindrospora TaxID=1849047 RepID=A0A3D8SDK6_9HELO|nr:hypothetical protein BP6252_01841 [Coleophoma cylindrospora]